MKRPYLLVGLLIIVLVLGALGVHTFQSHQQNQPAAAIVTASYLCRGGKSIDASYTATNVTLTLSDTRAFVLPHIVSGSGTRYEIGSTVFVTKGDNAFLEENGTQTYVDCVANGSPTSTATANGQKQFMDSAGTFTFMYPSIVSVMGGGVGYTADWMVNATTSGLILAKGTLSRSFQPNTNFSEATFIVGTSADSSAVTTCLTYNPSGSTPSKPAKATINGTTYTVLHTADAGAGNRYDTTSYRVLRANQFYVIEYTIHTTAIGNYDPSMGVKEYDQAGVTKIMEDMVQSFRFTDGV